jgi:hypothetical protein
MYDLLVNTIIIEERNKKRLKPGKVKSHTPTRKNILELLENIIVSVITFNDGSLKCVVSNKLNNNIIEKSPK